MQVKGKLKLADMLPRVKIWRAVSAIDYKNARITPPFNKLDASFFGILVIAVVTQIGMPSRFGWAVANNVYPASNGF